MTSLSPSSLLALSPRLSQPLLRRSSPSPLSLRIHSSSSSSPSPRFRRQISARTSMSTAAPPASSTTAAAADGSASSDWMNRLLFVEMGVGYDQHGIASGFCCQDITAAAMRACRDAISSNSIPAFRRGSIPGVSFEQMKMKIKLGVPNALQQFLDVDRVKSVFPYGKILIVEVEDGGLICSSGVYVEEMGDKNEDCYIVNAAVYVGY